MASLAPSDSFQSFEFDTALNVSADSSTPKSVPSKFNFTTAFTSDSLPVVDFSALIAGDPDQRSKSVHDLATACREWGFFILVNHGIPERLMTSIFKAMKEFFLSLADSEKKLNSTRPLFIDNNSNQSFSLWRDYLMLNVHPNFHCPHQLIREVVLEYSQLTRKLATRLIEAICEALELDQRYVNEVLKLDSSLQIFATNYYPRCPQPDQAIGIPSHTDPGLLTILIHDGVAGLQIEHDGKWFNVDFPQNSVLVNVADQLEIFSNGRCKSVKHRAVVNEERERMSIVVSNGPSGEAVVAPAAAPVEKDDGRAMYHSKKYEEYWESHLTKSRVASGAMITQDD